LSDWQDETEETGKTAFTAYLPERSQEFIRSKSDWAIQLTTNRVDIPWELLHDDHEFLCLSRPVGRRPQSLREQKVLPERKEGPLRALIVGNPNGDLPGAELEAGMIGDALRAANVEVELLLGEQATARQFARKIRNQMYDLIHFAGHAYFESKAPDMSGLMFHDNPMPAAELGRHLSSQALVFLSACEAGMAGVAGSHIGLLGEFVAGIAASILFGGAIGCVAPMWGIDDGVAKDFSISFYQNLLSGKIVGESLRQARLAVRKAGGHEDAWKAWVLYGDPTLAIDFERKYHVLSRQGEEK
jgi:CHAT domain-containing protein